MFKETRYLQNSFSIVFPRQLNIRRLANDFEDMLKEKYSQPQVISVPDELDAEIPRLIFRSKRGSSQIVISQLSIALNVVYTPDWQTNILKGMEYLEKRSIILFDMLNILEGVKPCFAGLTTTLRMPAESKSIDVIKHLNNILMKNHNTELPYDIQVKFTTIVSKKYYSNLTIQNYRTWLREADPGVQRLAKEKASEIGIQIVGDFNDRYAFNENEDYVTTKDALESIIDKGFLELDKIIIKVRG